MSAGWGSRQLTIDVSVRLNAALWQQDYEEQPIVYAYTIQPGLISTSGSRGYYQLISYHIAVPITAGKRNYQCQSFSSDEEERAVCIKKFQPDASMFQFDANLRHTPTCE
jgi:hypothetical protein